LVHCSFALLHGLTTCFWNVLLTLQDGHNIVQGLKNADGTSEKTECRSHVEYNIIWYCKTVGRPLWSSICEAWASDQFCSILPQMCSFLGLSHLCNGVLLFLFSTLLGQYIFEAFLYLRMGNCFDAGICRNHCISYNAFPYYMHIGFDGFVWVVVTNQ
jgi:hypothetical protein